MSNYLRREADSFVFRRRVPSALHQRLGLKEIYRSLKTTMRRTAKARAAHLFIATERLFRMVEEDDDEVLSDEDIQAAITYWLSAPTWSRRLQSHLHELSPGALRTCHQELPAMLLEMARPEYSRSFEAHLIEEAWSALGYSDYEGYARGETLKKAIGVLQKTLKEYVDKRMQAVFEPETLAAPPQSAQPVGAPTNQTKLSTFLDDWQRDIVAGYNQRKPLNEEETADQYLQSVKLFIGLMGNLSVGKITYEVAEEFRESLLKLPATHGKSRTGSVKSEIARARTNTTAPRMTMKTAKRHFSGMNSIWDWLVYKKHIPPKLDPFRGHSFPGTKSSKSARDDWSSEDLQLFFTSEIYRSAPRDSALHWLPLIAAFSGMRLEEICRLRPAHDLITRDGTYCFDIKKRDGWDPKSEAGARLVPVHSWLIKHGLREFVEAQRRAAAEHLFPELPLHRKKLGFFFSKDFSNIKINLGVGKKTAFHSFRHSFRTVLESTDLKESHIDVVMGHEPGKSEGRTYTKRVTTAKLKQVVESFSPVIDLSFVHTACNDGLSPIVTRTRKPTIKKRKLVPPNFDGNGKLIRTRSE
ncbi:site-specific integrase [Agrobacterium tumefaciens]|uniref:site-specific integrase n=1 Tax=Agrobacterium tumefaciens TaxID=358 RepID=UPI001CC04101|nr:site-specific integrase [Agrobacterium tumefaciens]